MRALQGKGFLTAILKAGARAARLTAAAAIALIATAHGRALADPLVGDPEAGKEIFGICKSCHQIGPRAKNRTGPILNNLLGRAAGSREGYASSFVMVLAGMRGLVWTPETLDAYLESPRTLVPKTASPFVGIPDAKQRADLIAYLLEAGAVD